MGRLRPGLSHNKEIGTLFTKSQLLPATMTVLCSGMELEVDWSPVLGSLTPPSVMASDVADLCRHRMGCSDGRLQPRLPFLGNHYRTALLQSCTVGLSPEINLRGPRRGSPHVNCQESNVQAIWHRCGWAWCSSNAPSLHVSLCRRLLRHRMALSAPNDCVSLFCLHRLVRKCFPFMRDNLI